MGIVAGALHAPGAAFIAWGLWVVGVMAGARSVYRYNTLNKHKDLGALADRMAAMAQSLITEALPFKSSGVRAASPTFKQVHAEKEVA
jgi:hypothetical protein